MAMCEVPEEPPRSVPLKSRLCSWTSIYIITSVSRSSQTSLLSPSWTPLSNSLYVSVILHSRPCCDSKFSPHCCSIQSTRMGSGASGGFSPRIPQTPILIFWYSEIKQEEFRNKNHYPNPIFRFSTTGYFIEHISAFEASLDSAGVSIKIKSRLFKMKSFSPPAELLVILLNQSLSKTVVRGSMQAYGWVLQQVLYWEGQRSLQEFDLI